MFTGIIKDIGEIEGRYKSPLGLRLRVKSQVLSGDCEPGSSVSVNGVCLTVVNIDRDDIDFEISEETLERTTIGKLSTGEKVNLEPALKVGEGFDGHIVQGHIDGISEVSDVSRESGGSVIKLILPENIMDFVVEKGSLAVDGVSLTIASIKGNLCSFAIIPFTLNNTNLQYIERGVKVNVEVDIIGKYIKKFLLSNRERSGEITKELLKEYGFIK